MKLTPNATAGSLMTAPSRCYGRPRWPSLLWAACLEDCWEDGGRSDLAGMNQQALRYTYDILHLHMYFVAIGDQGGKVSSGWYVDRAAAPQETPDKDCYIA